MAAGGNGAGRRGSSRAGCRDARSGAGHHVLHSGGADRDSGGPGRPIFAGSYCLLRSGSARGRSSGACDDFLRAPSRRGASGDDLLSASDFSLTVTALPFLPLPTLPPRKVDSHKGDFGRALLVGGSRGMSGAIALAGLATLRSGAGLVTLAVPDVCLDTVAAFEPSYMTAPLACDDAGRICLAAGTEVHRLAAGADCVACGPGLSRSPQLDQLVAELYEVLPQPLVLDADALNALAALGDTCPQAAAPRILTPHPGEFRRLWDAMDSRAPREDLCRQAVELAARRGWILVLKGHRSLVTDGQRVTYNTSGNPGMATGGAGDVLTGVITALVCQGLAPFDAARLGVCVHGLAGDLAAERLGQVSLIARDLVTYLPQAFQGLASGAAWQTDR